MALIDLECQNGHITENFPRMAKDWQTTPPCPECGEPTERIYVPPRRTWNVDPVIVYRASDGSFRFPGDPNGLSAKSYEKQGFERVELRGAADIRRFEKVMNRHEFSRAMRKAENLQKMREYREAQMRSELRSRMASMSRAGRDLARAAMRMNDDKPRERAKESGFHSEVFSYDRSNRDDSRDTHGRHRRD